MTLVMGHVTFSESVHHTEGGDQHDEGLGFYSELCRQAGEVN